MAMCLFCLLLDFCCQRCMEGAARGVRNSGRHLQWGVKAVPSLTSGMLLNGAILGKGGVSRQYRGLGSSARGVVMSPCPWHIASWLQFGAGFPHNYNYQYTVVIYFAVVVLHSSRSNLTFTVKCLRLQLYVQSPNFWTNVQDSIFYE